MSIPSLANLLIERATGSGNWVVVFKSLITVHHLMCYGNERFTQYLATTSSNATVFPSQLCSSFSDRSSTLAQEMSAFVRRYSKFLNAKAAAYRTLGADLTRPTVTPSSSSTGPAAGRSGSSSLRHSDKILKTLPVLQQLLDALLDFDAQPRDLNNGVMTSAFILLYRDLIRLFACFNDGIINLLEKFFSLRSRRDAREALDLYKRFLIRMDRVAEFLKTAEAVGVDKGDIPDLTRAPSSLLDALEAHCASMESQNSTSAPSSSSTKQQSKSSSGTVDQQAAAAAALEEEARYLSRIAAEKQQRQQQSSASANGASVQKQVQNHPFGTTTDDLLSGGSTAAAADSGGLMDLVGSEWPCSIQQRLPQQIMTQEILSLFESNSASCFMHSSAPSAGISGAAGPTLFPQQQQSGWPVAQQPAVSSNPFAFPAAASFNPNPAFQANFASAFPQPTMSMPQTLVPSSSAPSHPFSSSLSASSLRQQQSSPSAGSAGHVSSLNSLPGVNELFPGCRMLSTSGNRPVNLTGGGVQPQATHQQPASDSTSLI